MKIKSKARVKEDPCIFRDSCHGSCDWCKTHSYTEACVGMLQHQCECLRKNWVEAEKKAQLFQRVADILPTLDLEGLFEAMDRILERQKVYKLAIEQYGEEMQSIVALEELSEVQKEICKYTRGKGNEEHLAEEIADATIMLEQLCIIYDVDLLVEEYKRKKVQRLADNLKKGVK